ncbi:hypothetical protein PENSPDRAFT_693606 [Peniophora sp. CONT]|nr:hypothetical protein PENSPDRAFT_693606 [Peniophora sp. CONT]
MPPYQPPNHPVVFTNIETPGLDRRFPYWNGGGRNPPELHDGVEYRPAYCKHGWQAQERQPEWLHNTNRTFFGCHGYLKGYNQPDNWDCGYREEGIVGRGVKSIQVFNYAWDGRQWPFPTARMWMDRREEVSPRGAPLTPSPRKGSSTSGSGSQNPSPTKTASSSGSPPKKRKREDDAGTP